MFEEDTTEVAEKVEVQETPAEEVKEEVEETVAETPIEEEFKLPPPKKQTAQERINEITRKRRDAEREAEFLRNKLAEKEQGKIVPAGRPRLEDFPTQEEYEDAVADWRYDQREQTRKAELEKETAKKVRDDFYRKSAEFKKEYEDFEEIIEQPIYSKPMQDVIFRSDNGAMLAYYLGRPENRDTTDRIFRLPEIDQIYEMGKLETKLLLAKRTKKVTGATPPINPLGGKGGAPIDESKLSDDEWFKRAEAKRLEGLKKTNG